jgi:hypothetical protein
MTIAKTVSLAVSLGIFTAAAALSLGAPLGCNPGTEALLRAKVIEDRNELVGGPVAAAEVGDFLLENDQIRVAILGSRSSPAPGLFGGSVVDIDRRRPRQGFEGGNGRDRFSEAFPIANLLVPNPGSTEVRVLKDGSDGKSAAIRVEGGGAFLYEALAVLRNQGGLLESIFPNVRTDLRFVTDYIVAPGDRHIKVRTQIYVTATDGPTCSGVGACDLDCEHGYAQDENGCLACACSELLPLDVYEAPQSVFGAILGDTPMVVDPPAEHRAGVVAGDFVFFGNQNNVFAPGVGFDEDEAVQNAANQRQNTFTTPLTYDFVAAAGRDVSYGYLSLPPEGQERATVNVPIFASAATAFLVGGKQCLFDTADDDVCDAHRAFVYERYIVVGDGDIASVTEEMDRLRGLKNGAVAGFVTWTETGEAVPNAEVLVFADPDPGRDFDDIDQIAAANRELRGDVGVVNAIHADLGIDDVEDGDFHAALPDGSYLLVAMDPSYQAVSRPVRVALRSGEEKTAALSLPGLAYVDYRVTDATGLAMPGKLTFVSLDEDDRELEGDGNRRVYAGEGRLANGARLLELTATGSGRVTIEPGRYRVYVSRGPEYAVHTEKLELHAGQVRRIDATLAHEVDTMGWMSVDLHLHSAPSFDSGMAISRRVTTVVAEGLDVGVSTDHDVSTDYEPVVRDLRLEQHLKSFVSAEVTTLEYGHFIGFPLDYDHLDVPRHGSPDWSCLPGGGILDAIRAAGDGDLKPFTIVAHPRDGFFGYIDQSGVDTFTLLRKLDTLNQSNPVFRTVSCDFDAMEAMGAKRLDLTRTPSVSEVVDWTRCRDRLDASEDAAALLGSCPEMPEGTLAPCGERESFLDCKRRNRSRLAYYFTKRILERTPEEQAKVFDFTGDAEASQALCNPASFMDGPVPDETKAEPCAYRAGQVDDYFRYLEYGLTPTQVGSSDSHESLKEPGFPRTFFKSPTDRPEALEAKDAVDSLRAGHAVASYGPFVRATIDGKTFGEVVTASPGDKKQLELIVQTPSWFGTDRAEVYVNGHIVHELVKEHGPTVIEDFRVQAPITVPERDSWVVVITMGLRDDNQLRPVVFDIPFGEIQLSQTASGAFADVPVVNMILTSDPSVPDWSPIIPYAMTNPIWIDVDGNGEYDAPYGPPPFCSVPCTADEQCPVGQACLGEEGVCGIQVAGGCTIQRGLAGGD